MMEPDISPLNLIAHQLLELPEREMSALAAAIRAIIEDPTPEGLRAAATDLEAATRDRASICQH